MRFDLCFAAFKLFFLTGLFFALANLNAQSVSATEVPGNLKGDFSVSLVGSAQYVVSLSLPDGTSGMTPKLALSYDSNSGPGVFGLGWTLVGLSAITPTPHNKKLDGGVSPVNFDANDSLSLDGGRLVELPPINGNRYFAKAIDDGTRIEELLSGGSPYFIVRTKSGLRLFLGYDPDANIDSRVRTSNSKIIAWPCVKVLDTFGNYISFSYATNSKGDWGLQAIDYTGNKNAGLNPYASLRVSYSNSANPTANYISGERIEHSLIATEVEISVHGSPYRRYKFNYQDTGRLGSRRLTSITEEGVNGDTHKPTIFSYAEVKPGWKETPDLELPALFGSDISLEDGYRFVDLNSSGTPYILYSASFIDPVTRNLRPYSYTYQLTSSGWAPLPDLAIPEPLVTGSGRNNSITFFDIDGDNLVDLLVSVMKPDGSVDSKAYRQEGGKWIKHPEMAFPLPFSVDGKRALFEHPVRMQSGEQGLVIYDTTKNDPASRLWFWKYDQSAHWVGTQIETTTSIAGTQFSDVDITCNGLPKFLVADGRNGSIHLFDILKNTDGSYSASLYSTVSLGEPIQYAVAKEGACDHIIVRLVANQKLVEIKIDHTGTPSVVPIATTAPVADIGRISVAPILKHSYDDLVFTLQTTPGKDIATLTFDPISRTWGDAPTYDRPVTASTTRLSSGYLPLPVDLDQDGRVDMLFLPTTQVLPPIALLNTVAGWSVQKQYVPPILFSQKDKLGARPELIDLNGDGLLDLVEHFKAGDGALFKGAAINTASGWIGSDELVTPHPLTYEKSGTTGIIIDVNGDGLPDFLYSFAGVHEFWRNTVVSSGAANTAGHWILDTSFPPPPEDFSVENQGDLGVRFIDLNGDGRIDMLVSRRESDGSLYSRAYTNTGSSWVETPKFRLPVPIVSRFPGDVTFETPGGDYYRDIRGQFMDIRGDGGISFIYRYQFLGFFAGVSRGCQNRDWIETKPDGTKITHKHPIPTDTTCAGALVLTDSGWVPQPDAFLPPLNFDEDIKSPGTHVEFLDLNNDGLLDILFARPGGGLSFLNTGAGWAHEAGYDLPGDVVAAGQQQPDYRFVDANGDGLIDIIFSRSGVAGGYLNNGYGWSRSQDYAPPIEFVDSSGKDSGVIAVDVLGSGLQDLIQSEKSQDGTVTRKAFLNQGARPDVLVSVLNGLGLETKFQYRSLLTLRPGETASDLFYTPSPISEYPVISRPPTLSAVEKLTVVEGDNREVWTTYKYKGFRFDVQGQTALGFEAREAVNIQNGIREHIVLNQTYELNGRPKSTESALGAETLAHTDFDYVVIRDGATEFPFQVYEKSEASSTYDTQGALTGLTTKSFAYDGLGDVVSSCVVYGDSSWTFVSNVFDPSKQNVSPDVWFVGRLTSARVTNAAEQIFPRCEHVDGASSDKISSGVAEFSYDPETGVLTSETANATSSLPLKTTYGRDIFGNVTRTEKVDIANRIERENTLQFDPEGRFVLSEQNGLGHKASRKWNPLQGVVSKDIDPNGVAQTKFYDGFDEFLKSITDDGLTSTSAREFTDNITINGVTAVIKIREQIGDLPPEMTFLDRQGRRLRTVKTGLGGRSVFQDYQYDLFGRAVAVSLPYFEGAQPRWVSTKYDVLGRVIGVTRPDGASAVYEYVGNTTTSTDFDGRTTVKRSSQKGYVTEIDEGEKRTQFQYGPAGRLIRTTEIDGKFIEAHFDDVGNKITSIDPDLGLWEYKYNAFGQVIWQKDAKKQISTLQYDPIGRPKIRVTPDRRTEYRYDDGPYAKGAVVSVFESDGYAENYEYDRNGRVQRRIATIDGEAIATFITYDVYGRVGTTFYPGGILVKNKYSDEGFLSEVLTSDSELGTNSWTRHWKCLERDQAGRVKLEELGNGITTRREYDENIGATIGIASESATGKQVYDLILKYDRSGNLQSRDTLDLKRHEEFQYDELNRIKEWKVNAVRKASYEYDDDGRILFKSDIGFFHYDDAAHVHAVTSISSGLKAQQSGPKYVYDANGDMTESPTAAISYNSKNQLTKIISSKELWSSFKYGPDGSRYYEMSREYSNTKVSLSVGAYQKINEYWSIGGKIGPDLVRHRVFVSSDSGVIAVVEHNSEINQFNGELPPSIAKLGRGGALVMPFKPVHYILSDQLGSVARITDERGHVEASYSYDPWGQREDAAFAQKTPVAPGEAIGNFNRGFTGHEQLDALGLIHMNGRVYDSRIGRFLSADPTLQSPLKGQNYDRYQYAANNPLRYIDPNGYGIWGDIWNGITTPFKKAFQWVAHNWQTIVIVVVAVVITVASYGTLGPVAAGMLAGAAAGALGAWFYGGNVFEGAFVGAVFGALSAGFGEGLGAAVGSEFGSTAGTVAGSVGRGLISGAQSEYYGGGFWQGFASGAVSQALSGYVSHLPNYALQTLGAFVVGGTVSVIGGGKFENGAITAAYASLLAGTLVEGLASGRSIGESLVEFGERVLDLGTKIITLPNTAIGMAWGGLGVLFGGDIPTLADFDRYNALVFRNNPLMAAGGAITFGNAVVAGACATTDGCFITDVLEHESYHTWESQALGLGYIPANAIGVTLGFASGGWAWGRGAQYDFWAGGMHGNLNFMEGSPFSSKLYGGKL